MLLKHSEARAIAQSIWGTGGTSAYRTNRRGVFYFSCSGHGGYVVDAAALTDAERAAIAPYYGTTEEYRRFVWGKRSAFWHPNRPTRCRFSVSATEHRGQYYVFEEDCDWTILEKLTPVRAWWRDKDGKFCMPSEETRDQIFARWIAPRAASHGGPCNV